MNQLGFSCDFRQVMGLFLFVKKKKKKKLKIEQLDSKQERSPNRSNQTIAPKPTETNLKME